MTVEKLKGAQKLLTLIEDRERQINQLYRLENLRVNIGYQCNSELIRGDDIPDSISDYIISYLRAGLSEDLEHLKKQFENL